MRLLLPAAVLLLLASSRPGACFPAGGEAWILVFRDDTADSPALARALARHSGGRVRHAYDRAMKGCAIEGLSPGAVAALAALPEVVALEPDRADWTISTHDWNWGIDRIDDRDLPLNSRYTWKADGSGVTAFVLDSGVRIGHQEFGGRATHGYDFVDNDAVADDAHGHGTHVAGILGGSAKGVAKNVSIVAVRVLNASGQGNTSDVIAGINWITANATPPAVVNVSFGGPGNTLVDNAVQASINAGIVYVVAAGNGDTGNPGVPGLGTPQPAANYSPGRVPACLTVGATESDDDEGSFSNYGAAVDLLAPGVGIVSSWNSSDSAFATSTGTSMAAPHVAGAVALFLQTDPTATIAEVETAIESNATPGKITGMTDPINTPNLLLYSVAFDAGLDGLQWAADHEDDDAPWWKPWERCGSVGVDLLLLPAGIWLLRRRFRIRGTASPRRWRR